ncbi:MAG: hypothetical protein ACRECY_15590, partial [Phyllobacterium sp.]
SNLTIESTPDRATQKADQLSIGGAFGGGSKTSLTGALQKAKGDAVLVGEQSGIHAGEEGFDIDVKGKTTLKGGLITSQAPANRNTLVTGTLEFSDIDTHSDWKAKTYGGTLAGLVPTLAPPLHADEDKTGKALSAVSPAAITITDPANQKQSIADLRRDTANTNTSLPGLPELKHVLDEQYRTQDQYQQAAATLAGLIGDMAGRFEKAALERNDPAAAQFWGEGGAGRAALHALGGALLGGVNDAAGAIKGALGGALSTLTAPAIHDVVAEIVNGTRLANTQEGKRLIDSVTASLVQGLAGSAGGLDAAAYAGHEVKYNYLTHQELEEYEREREACASEADRTACEARVDEKRTLLWRSRQEQSIATCQDDPASCHSMLSAMQGDLAPLLENYDAHKQQKSGIDRDIQALVGLEWTMLEVLNQQGNLTPQEQARLEAHRLGDLATIVGALSMLSKPVKTTVGEPNVRYNLLGYRTEFYDVNGKPIQWRNPLTNQIEDIPPGMNMHKDHILPIKAIKEIAGFDKLSTAQQKAILNDPRNFQPLDGAINCSKGCKVEGSGNEWLTYKRQPLNPDYLRWLKEQQDDMRTQLQEAVNGMKKVDYQ